MNLRNLSVLRLLFFPLLLAAPVVGIACLEPEIYDTEMGCGVDPNINPKCPNRPATDAGPASPDGAKEVGADTGEAGTVTPDTGAKVDTPPSPADTAVDLTPAPDARDAPSVDTSVDKPAVVAPDASDDSAPAGDASVD